MNEQHSNHSTPPGTGEIRSPDGGADQRGLAPIAWIYIVTSISTTAASFIVWPSVRDSLSWSLPWAVVTELVLVIMVTRGRRVAWCVLVALPILFLPLAWDSPDPRWIGIVSYVGAFALAANPWMYRWMTRPRTSRPTVLDPEEPGT